MKNILLIVANASRARLYRVRHGRLEQIEQLDHPESRAKGSELTSDRPGRNHDQGKGGGHNQHRSGMEPEVDAREVELVSFAREVARRAGIHARRGRDPEVILFAPPRFLGRLKAALDGGMAKRVVASVSHDYTSKDESELVQILSTFGVQAALPTPA